MTKNSKKEGLTGLLMALPTIAGLMILNFYPLCRTVYMSFFQSGSFGKWTFVGVNNYVKMFQSASFWKVTGNTLLFMVYTVPLTVIFGLFIAVMLDQKIQGKSVFRAIYFLPMVVAPAAVAMVWKWLFNTDFGIINLALGALRLPSGTNWISDPKTALGACAVVTIWSSVGYDAILLLSGLQGISRSYYEAARIDGATPFQQFRKITLPLVSPTLFFVLIMRIMAALKVFDIVYMMIEKTNPAIRNCETILYNFYQETFVKNNKGYGAALVVWCVVIISVITAIQFIGQRKWVTYDI